MDVEGDAPIRLMTSNIQQTVQIIYKQNKYLTLYQHPESRPRELPTLEPPRYQPWKLRLITYVLSLQ